VPNQPASQHRCAAGATIEIARGLAHWVETEKPARAFLKSLAPPVPISSTSALPASDAAAHVALLAPRGQHAMGFGPTPAAPAWPTRRLSGRPRTRRACGSPLGHLAAAR
jgi:hypothetical protein